jgi:hypothetical protein
MGCKGSEVQILSLRPTIIDLTSPFASASVSNHSLQPMLGSVSAALQAV